MNISSRKRVKFVSRRVRVHLRILKSVRFFCLILGNTVNSCTGTGPKNAWVDWLTHALVRSTACLTFGKNMLREKGTTATAGYCTVWVLISRHMNTIKRDADHYTVSCTIVARKASILIPQNLVNSRQNLVPLTIPCSLIACFLQHVYHILAHVRATQHEVYGGNKHSLYLRKRTVHQWESKHWLALLLQLQVNLRVIHECQVKRTTASARGIPGAKDVNTDVANCGIGSHVNDRMEKMDSK